METKTCLGCGGTETEGVAFVVSNPSTGMGLCARCSRVPLNELIDMINTVAKAKFLAARSAIRRL